MNLPPQNLAVRRLVLKEAPVLALDTGRDPESAEGLRLAKVARGTGWFWLGGRLVPWTTRGVVAHQGRLLVWGEADGCPEGQSPSCWPGADPEFLKALVAAWTAVVQAGPWGPFTPSALVPYHTEAGWAFAFVPADVRSALDAFQPRGDRLDWEPFVRPDDQTEASWMFASAALGLSAWGPLPWTQDDEEALRQEMRELPKTLDAEELPPDLESGTKTLWFDSLTGQGTVARWTAWLNQTTWRLEAPGAESPGRRQAQERRLKRRRGAAFWRRRGTLVGVVAGVSLAVLLVVGSVVWGAIKPDPTDTWTPQEVVRGYYTALETLDDQLLGKVSSGSRDPVVVRDRDEVTNRYVIRQVRTAYEHQSPVLEADAWERSGKPTLNPGQMLYGLTNVSFQGSGTLWTIRYQLWVSEGGDATTGPQAVGEAVVDQLTLVKTDRGWKVLTVRRESQPLS